jgi:phosphopentomutase
MIRESLRFILIVLDGVGCGSMPDSAEYRDGGANTLGNLAKAVPSMRLPNFARIGLSCIVPSINPKIQTVPFGAYGRAHPLNKAKDTVSGHWEIAGIVQDPPFRTYPHGFPQEIIQEWCKRSALKGVLGNRPASGTVIIEELGEEHLRTGLPILYTSADSVFQVATHEDVIPPLRLYEICRIARELLRPPHLVARVIARPFLGEPGCFKRAENRRDFSVPPSGTTLLDKIYENDLPVVTIGKIDDIFCKRGITYVDHTSNNGESIRSLVDWVRNGPEAGMVFANLGDFDTLYGHRRNPYGYAKVMEEFDAALPMLFEALRNRDIVIITSDHGCDPTFELHSDHTREGVPLLLAGDLIRRGYDLGIRTSLADISATICQALGLDSSGKGKSFWKEVTCSREGLSD